MNLMVINPENMLFLDNGFGPEQGGNMNPRISHRKTAALTRVEVLVLVAVVFVLGAGFIFAAHRGASDMAKRINCVNHLKQIGLAYRIWANDNDDKFPMQVSVSAGGTMGLATGRNAWINFFVMSNELTAAKVLCCPADKGRIAKTNFQAGFDNQNVSYFVGLDADIHSPDAFLSGDSNFAISGVPVKSGGLDLATNMPVTWTSARHSYMGNINLVDGSIADGSGPDVNASVLTNLLSRTGLATNHLAIP